MSYYAAAAIVVTTLYQVDENKKAEDRGNREAKKTAADAKAAAAFAETEGEGQGMTGTVRLGVDETVNTKVGSTLRL